METCSEGNDNSLHTDSINAHFKLILRSKRGSVPTKIVLLSKQKDKEVKSKSLLKLVAMFNVFVCPPPKKNAVCKTKY